MKKSLIVGFLFICTSISVYSQEELSDSDKQPSYPRSAREIFELEDKKKLLLSLSTSDYPVTPGDVYRITYVSADNEISYDTIVENDCVVNLGIFGKIDAKNLAFPELRGLVEQLILKAYPDSMPTVTISLTGEFQIYVSGEVNEARYVTGWGLSRLSHLIDKNLTQYASLRDVEVVSQDGKSKIYDLFRAKRFGERQYDPYLRPGDTVMFHEKQKEILLQGAVKRNGNYQLLHGEGLRELVEEFGGGFKATADPSRIRLERIVTGKTKIAESIIIDLSQGYANQPLLMDYDRIVVPEKTDYLPVIFIEGAIQQEIENVNSYNSNNSNIPHSQVLSVSIKEGDTLYHLLWDQKDKIQPTADLTNALIHRSSSGEVIPVDIQALLYEYRTKDDIVLKPYDRVIIPFRQFLVLVTGAVYDPGQYPYVPNQTYSYYLKMAGGVNPEFGTNRVIKVTNKYGENISKESYLEPESHIYVPYSFSYYFLKYFPIVVSSAAAIFNLVRVLEIYEIVP